MDKKDLSLNEEFGHEMGDHNSAKIIDLLIQSSNKEDKKINDKDDKKKHRT